MNIKAIKNLIKKEIFAEEFACVCCGEERLDNRHNFLCDKCFNELESIDYSCNICGDKVSKGELICDSCKEFEHKIEKNIACFKYSNTAKELVYLLKYFGKLYVAPIIAEFMSERLKKSKLPKIDRVIAVPLTMERLKSRGYNQAEVLAREISKSCNLRFCENFVIRIKETPSQTHLKREERVKNMLDAFFVVDNAKIKGENILVIDDVFTTGATMDAIAGELKKKGAKKVFGLTFCHA